MNITTLNVKGIRDFRKRKRLNIELEDIKRNSVIFMQETHSTTKDEKNWKANFGAQSAFFSHGTNNSTGVAILINLEEEFMVIQINGRDVYQDIGGRLLGMCIEYKGNKYGLVNVYAPNIGSKKHYLEYLTGLDNCLDELEGNYDDLIVGGDFNLIMNGELDARGGHKVVHKDCVEYLQMICEKHSLVDLFRTRKTGENNFTWAPPGHNPKNIFRRLDYFFVYSSRTCKISKLQNNKINNSDHNALTFTLQRSTDTKKLGLWRHNDSLLKIPGYIESLKEVITNLELGDLSNNRGK
jgi:exonuclease III